MFHIVWYHVRACVRDLRSYRTGELEVYTRPSRPGQLYVGDGRREWRIR